MERRQQVGMGLVAMMVVMGVLAVDGWVWGRERIRIGMRAVGRTSDETSSYVNKLLCVYI
jgi:hypothetical protein